MDLPRRRNRTLPSIVAGNRQAATHPRALTYANPCKKEKPFGKNKDKNIQQLTFAGRHRPNYYLADLRLIFG